MTAYYSYLLVDFTDAFLESFASKDFSAADRSALREALQLLDQDERHPSLRIHQLQGDRQGSWSASAGRALRMTFFREPDGRKRMLTCSRHYDR